MMKKVIAYLFLFIFISCSKQQVNDYYLVAIEMPHLVKSTYGMKATEPKIGIEKLQTYSNDSTAIAAETKRSDDFIADIPHQLKKTLKEQIKPTDADYMKTAKEKAIREVYEELLDRKLILLRISHIENFDLSEYLDLIKEHGLNSEHVRRYANEKQLDVFIHTIKE